MPDVETSTCVLKNPIPKGRAALPMFADPEDAGRRDVLIAMVARFDKAVFAPPLPDPHGEPVERRMLEESRYKQPAAKSEM